MGFFKKRGKVLLAVSFCLFILLQQIAVHYRRTYASTLEVTDADGHDTVAFADGHDTVALYEINRLEEVWRQADVADLVTPQKMTSPTQLEGARARLKQAEIAIQESEKRVRGVTGEKREFFAKAHAYYRHSAAVLLAIVDFLVAAQGEYSVQENEMCFDSESNATRFRGLIEQLSSLHREKEDLDTFISHHNRAVEKHSLVR